MKLKLFNQRGNPHIGQSLNSESGFAGVQNDGCSVSNADGIIVCKFRSLVPGTFTVQFKAGEKVFSVEITFLPNGVKTNWVRVSPSQMLEQSAAGYSVSTSIRHAHTIDAKESGYQIRMEPINLNITF